MSERYLCVALHDVAPARWRACERTLAAIREVADIPLTLLVVPAYHGQCSAQAPGFEAAMSAMQSAGHELALHGYFHLDAGAPSAVVDWIRRRVYTAGEGEFSALDCREAAERLLLGQRWFDANGWRLSGFVPPAWLLGEGAWHALRQSGAFDYVTTLTHLHFLRESMALHAPCFGWSVRSAWRRVTSLAWNPVLLRATEPAPLVRVALHPNDADHPHIRRSWQRALDELLRTRTAITKAEFVELTRSARSHPRVRPAVAGGPPLGPRNGSVLRV